jgi:hypothetical protein
MPQRFESLRERLLRAGVAPRHVNRYLRELHEHHEDGVRAELEKGAPLAAAQEAAWARLGTEESLAQGMLTRPELRSRAARFPGLIFGLAPAFTWIGAPIALAAVLSLLPEANRRTTPPEAAFIDAFHALCFVYTRLLPVLLGSMALEAAARRRSRAFWPLVGAGAVDVLAGTVTVYSFPGQLGVTSSLLPFLLPFTDTLGPTDVMALGEGLLRAACMLALSLLVQRLIRRLGSSDRATPAAG